MFIEEDISGDNEAPDTHIDIDCLTWKKSSNGLLIVPQEHRQTVLKQCHDSEVTGHWGKHRTQELVSRDFTWERCREDITEYVASCPKCQKSMFDRHSRQTKLIPMPTSTKPWEKIALDFIGWIARIRRTQCNFGYNRQVYQNATLYSHSHHLDSERRCQCIYMLNMAPMRST